MYWNAQSNGVPAALNGQAVMICASAALFINLLITYELYPHEGQVLCTHMKIFSISMICFRVDMAM